MKKFLALALAIIIVAAMVPAFAVFADGPVEIASAEDFYALFIDDSTHITGSYKLTKDITITHGLSAGKEQAVFEGVFDGNGHTITVDFNRVNARTGVFCTAGGEGCTIKNLTVDGTITSTGNSCGGVVGTAKGPITFENVTSKVYIEASGDSTGSSGHAGLLGVNEGQTVTFKNCTSSATVLGNRSAAGFVGLVRDSNSKEVFEDCVFDGTVVCTSGWSDSRGAGGFVGRVHANQDEVDITFKNCASNGTVSSDILSSAWVATYARYNHPDQLPVYDNCTQTAKVYISGYRISDECDTRYPEAQDTQANGNVSYDAENKTVSGWTNFAANANTATELATAEGGKVYVNGALDETAEISANGRQIHVVCKNPKVTEGTGTSIIVVFGNGHYTTLGQTYNLGDNKATFTNAGGEVKLGYSEDALKLIPAYKNKDAAVISTPEEFAAYTKTANQTVFGVPSIKVTADLDMRNIKDFQPILQLTSILDFEGHTISNLVVTTSGNGNMAGLIAHKTNNHVGVRNLKLDNCKLITDAGDSVGVVVGYCDRAVCNNITVKNVTVEAPNAKNVGGLEGQRNWGSGIDPDTNGVLDDVIFNIPAVERFGVLTGVVNNDAKLKVVTAKATKLQINAGDSFDTSAVGAVGNDNNVTVAEGAEVSIAFATTEDPAVGYVEPKDPFEITKGAKTTIKVGSEKDVAITTKNGEIDSVTVDGTALTDADYTVQNGVVTIKVDFIKTLAVGKHTVVIASGNETVQATITISEPAAPAPTGDSAAIVLMIVAVISLAGVAVFAKKRVFDK